MGEVAHGGGCCPPMDLFRSEPMQLIQLIIPIESAHRTVSYLGDLGLLQFKDVSIHPFLNSINPSLIRFRFIFFSLHNRYYLVIRVHDSVYWLLVWDCYCLFAYFLIWIRCNLFFTLRSSIALSYLIGVCVNLIMIFIFPLGLISSLYFFAVLLKLLLINDNCLW
jgi:hypothetical protein